VLDRFELSEGRLLGIMPDNASSNHSMTRELESTLDAPGIEWPALRNHIPCMAHVIQLALGALMSSIGEMAAPSHGKPMSVISNSETINA